MELRPRRIGPGRIERDLRSRVERLGAAAESARAEASELAWRLERRERELETSQRLERGCQRLLDRWEERDRDRAEALERSERAQKRLILALGALQRENELLHARIAASEGPGRGAAARREVAPKAPRRRLLARRARKSPAP